MIQSCGRLVAGAMQAAGVAFGFTVSRCCRLALMSPTGAHAASRDRLAQPKHDTGTVVTVPGIADGAGSHGWCARQQANGGRGGP